MNCTLARNLFVIHHSLWNHPLMVFGLHEYRPIYRFEASAVEAVRPILCQNSYKTFRIIQWWYLCGKMILNSFSQLFIGDNTVNRFVNDCPNLNFHNFHAWDRSCEHSPGCTRTFGCGGCPSMQQSGPSLTFVFVCLLYDLLSFLFHCRLCIWDQRCLGWNIFYGTTCACLHLQINHVKSFLEISSSERILA